MANKEDTTDVFDIVIIGAGTAGCVLANRLSEDSNISVLVLEAGEYRNDDERIYTPGLSQTLLDDPEFDWQYLSEPQPGINGRRMKHPRGKVVGGSSAINSFALIYPSAMGMDAWFALGNEGWGWDGTKEYFGKFQTVSEANEEVRGELSVIDSVRESKGPIQASFPLTVTPLQKAWVETFRELGLENKRDPLEGNALGGYLSTNHISNDRHERSHAGVAYLEPVLARPNLTLITGATVGKILFDRSSGNGAVATGVKYVKDGSHRAVRARKEVLLAAGVFASPQLLELSGVGDAKLLMKHGIEVVHDNPNVGENLQDHMRCGISFEPVEGVQVQDPLPVDEARKLYMEERRGPWADRACYVFAYMPLDRFLSTSENQRLSALLDEHVNDRSMQGFEQERNTIIKRVIRSPCEATATAFLSRRPAPTDPTGPNRITLLSMLSHPFSYGTSHIVSSEASKKPRIDFGYYGNPLDLEIHGRHVQALAKLGHTAPLANYIKKDGKHLPTHPEDLTLERAKEHVRDYASTNYHPCGTCSMMPENLGGVVDHRLKVYGTTNVRVVDASIMPIIPRGNIVSTVYAVAEKAADLISNDIGVKRST